jgi:hypothetical protein
MDRPFSDAWLVLKRQTKLSEYEGFEELEDMPVPNKPQKIGIPTHINRMFEIDGGMEYSLMSGKTKLGHIINDIDADRHGKIEDFGGRIEPDYRKQGLYQKLLNALIQNNKRVISNNRNILSHPTHKKFQQNLPDNVAYYSPPEGNKLNIEDHGYNEGEQTFDYQKKPSVEINYDQSKPKYGMMGEMQRYDYGSLPIRNVDNLQDIEYENKPVHEKMTPHFSDPNNQFRHFMRLDEFNE